MSAAAVVWGAAAAERALSDFSPTQLQHAQPLSAEGSHLPAMARAHGAPDSSIVSLATSLHTKALRVCSSRNRPFMTFYNLVSLILRKFVPGYSAYKRKKNFSSHMPILIGLGLIAAPRRVLELGSGTISTPAFLDPALFPSLECLDSVEDDPDWGETLSRHIGPHRKLRLHQVASVPEWAATADLSVYDLVFIDDSKTIEQREQTIRHVLARVAPETVVVIHDFEMPPYQDAVPAGFERIAFSSFLPMTGVVWRSARWTVAISQLAGRIDARKKMSPLRHSAWRRYLASGTGPAG